MLKNDVARFFFMRNYFQFYKCKVVRLISGCKSLYYFSTRLSSNAGIQNYAWTSDVHGFGCMEPASRLPSVYPAIKTCLLYFDQQPQVQFTVTVHAASDVVGSMCEQGLGVNISVYILFITKLCVSISVGCNLKNKQGNLAYHRKRRPYVVRLKKKTEHIVTNSM